MPVPEPRALRSSPVLRVRGLSRTYTSSRGDVVALRDVSFELRRGERLAIVGGSGAGKSTLLRCLNLLVKPTRGSVEVDGEALTALRERDLATARRSIGMVFQHFALLHRRTVRENVALPLELARGDRAALGRRVDELLDHVRLRDKADAYPSELSGGQRQRVGIARALAHAPSVLLCDEPTSALDAETARHVVRLLDDLSSALDLTIVFVTHQLELVRALADSVAVLDDGELRELTPSAEFFAQPRSPAGRRLLAPEASTTLPERLLEEARSRAGVGPSTLVRIAVASSAATSDVFRTLFQHPSLRVDVVGADIASQRDAAAGALALVIHGDPSVIHEAIAALERQSIHVEVFGHVLSAA